MLGLGSGRRFHGLGGWVGFEFARRVRVLIESLTLLSQRLNARGGEGEGKGGVLV